MKNSLRIPAILLSLMPTVSIALELGFESSLFFEDSRIDNAVPERTQTGVDGTLGIFGFSLFGQEKSDRADGGFLAELRAERLVNDDEDNNPDSSDETFTRFYGGISLATPLRSLNWYVGDVLAGVLAEDQLQSNDDTGDRQVNVFITGPEISTSVGVRKTLDLHLYYASQSDDTDNDLDTLYNLGADFTSELSGGRKWGLRISDVYTDKPATAINSEDYNRFSAAIFVARQRGVTTLDAELGGTQYYSNGDGTNGLRLGLNWNRALSNTQSLSLGFSHDLIDQTLGTLEDLTSGQTAREEINGVSADTGAALRYQYQTGANSVFLGLGAIDSDFQLVANDSGFTSSNNSLRDTRSYSAAAGLTRELSARIGLDLELGIERLEYLNRPDEIDSLSVTAALTFALNNRWSVVGGARHLQEEGATTSVDFNNGTVSAETPLDETENRVFLGVRWAPPTRASRDAGGVVRSFL